MRQTFLLVNTGKEGANKRKKAWGEKRGASKSCQNEREAPGVVKIVVGWARIFPREEDEWGTLQRKE